MRRKLAPLLWTLAILVEGAAGQSGTPFRQVRVLRLQARTAHVQGIDTDGRVLWLTSVDRASRKGYLQEFAVEDGRLQRTVEVQDGERFHPGGMAAESESIWMPVAEYRAASSAVIQKRSQKTLALEFQFRVDDHIGCVAVTPELVIGGNWDSHDFYVWDHRGVLLRKISNTSGNAYQDLKVRGGQLVASGLLQGRRGAVDLLDLSTLKLLKRVSMGDTDRAQPYTREGMTIFGNRLWMLPEDGDSRLFLFDLPEGFPDR